MVLTVICSFGCGSGTTFTLILTGVVNPGSTRPITNSFTIYSFYLEGVNEYKVDESIVTTVANLGLVPNSFVSHATSSGTVITGDITSYTTVVRIRNPIPASGKFQVVFPADIALASNTSITLSSVLSPAVAGISLTQNIDVSSRTTSMTFSHAVPANTQITFRVSNVRNPQSFKPSAAFRISSFEVVGANSYQIDQLSTFTITMSDPNRLSGLQLIRVPTNPGETVPLVNRPQSHYFQFTLFNPIPQNGKVVVTYNSQQVVIPTGGTFGVFQATSITQVTSTSILTGVVSTTTFTVLPCSAAQCAGGSTLRFMFTGARTPDNGRLPTSAQVVVIQSFTHVYPGDTFYQIDRAQGDFVFPVSYGPLNNLVIDRVEFGTTTQQDQVGQNSQLIATWTPTNDLQANSQFQIWFSQKFVYQQGNLSTQPAMVCSFGLTGGSLTSQTCRAIQNPDDTIYQQKFLAKVGVSTTASIAQSDVDARRSYTITLGRIQNPFSVNQARSGTIAAFTFQTTNNETINSALITPPNAQLPILSPGTLTSVTIRRTNSAQQIVDQPVTLTFTLTTATKVIEDHSVIFYIPRPFFEVVGSSSPFRPTCSVPCSGTVTNSLITIVATNLICSSGFPCASMTPATFSVTGGLKNAYNLASQTGRFIIRTTTANAGHFVDQFSNSALLIQPQLVPSTTSAFSIDLEDNKAGQIISITINFTIGSRVLPNDYLQIQFAVSDQLFKKPTSTAITCTKIVSGGAQIAISSCVPTLSGNKITKVRANQFCSPSGCAGAQSLSLRISNVELLGVAKNVPLTTTVNTKTQNPSGADFQIGTGSFNQSITIAPNNFVNPSINSVIEGACTTGEIEQICSLRFTLTTKNPFPTLANNGKLQIIVPTNVANLSYLSFNANRQTSACTTNTIDGSSTGVACTVNVASNSITLTHSGLDTDDKVIIIVVSHILLPNSTKPTAAFTIRSFSASFYIDEVIDLTFAPKPGTLLNTSVTRAAPRIRESTQYVFTFTTTHAVPTTYIEPTTGNHALVKVQLPPIAEVQFNTDSGLDPSIVCTIQKRVNGAPRTLSPASTFTASRAKAQPTTVQFIKFNNICRAGQQCPAGTQITITCPSAIIKNKQYKKLDLDNVTDSIQMGMSTPGSLDFWFDAKIQQLFATPALEPGQLTVNSLARGGNRVSELVTLTTNVTPLFSDHINTGKLIFNVNVGIFLDPVQNIQAVNSANSATIKTAEVIRQRANTNPVEIDLLSINQPCGASVFCPLNTAFGYEVRFVKNPIVAIIMPPDPMEIYTATTEGYQLDRGFSRPLNQIFSSLQGAQFTSVRIWAEDPTVSRETPYDFIFKVNTNLPSTAQLDLRFSSTTLTLLSSPSCSDLFDAANTSMACSVVNNSAGESVLRISSIISTASATPPNLASGYFGLKVRNIRNPADTNAPGNINAKLFIPAGVVAQGDYPVPAAKTAIATSACSQSCRTCAGTPDFCTSCLSPGLLPFMNGQTSTCLNTCAQNQFLNPIDNKCYECESSCQTCFGYRGEDCLTCVSPKHKSDSSCVDNCPALTTATIVNGISVCQNNSSPSGCTAPCLTCSTSATYCLTCDTSTTTKDTINPLTGTCVSSTTPSPHECTAGWYPVASGNYKSCARCFYLCGTCTQRANKCLSCKPTVYVQNIHNAIQFTCSALCVDGQYLSNSGCRACNPICSLCVGRQPNQCTRCNQFIPDVQARLYLHESQCVTQCPHPYSENVNNETCDNPPFSLSKSIPLFIEMPLLVAAITMILVSVCVVGSKSIKNGGGKFIWWNALYALISLIQFVNRFLLLGTLFDKRYPVHFAINFTVLFTSLFLGMLLHIFYFQPLTYISVYYSKLYKKFRCGFLTVIIFSYIGGSNVFRLISSKFLGLRSLSNSFGIYTFWIRPLEVFGWFMGALSIGQILLCIVMLATFPIYNDAYMCAILGMIWNCAIVVMQICTWVYVQKRYPLSRLDEEEDGLIDVQHPMYAKK